MERLTFRTQVTEVHLNNTDSLHDEYTKDLYNFEFFSGKALIAWSIKPVGSSGIKFWNFKLEPNSFVKIDWKGEEQGKFQGNDEDGDPEFDDGQEVGGDYDFDLSGFESEFQVEHFYTPNDFTITRIEIDFEAKFIKLII